MRFLAKQREVIVDLRQSNQPSRAATQSSRKIFHKFEKDDKVMLLRPLNGMLAEFASAVETVPIAAGDANGRGKRRDERGLR